MTSEVHEKERERLGPEVGAEDNVGELPLGSVFAYFRLINVAMPVTHHPSHTTQPAWQRDPSIRRPKATERSRGEGKT